MHTLSDFAYTLPEHLIAQYPKPRGTSHLLCVRPPNLIQEQKIPDLASLLTPGDLIVTNNTKVLRARVFFQRMTGGIGEILVERMIDEYSAYGQFKISKH